MPLTGSERGERGLRGEEGQELSQDVGAWERGSGESGEKSGSPCPQGVSGPKFITRERSHSSRHAKDWFGSGCLWSSPGGVRSLRGPGCASIAERDFFGLAGGGSAEAIDRRGEG